MVGIKVHIDGIDKLKRKTKSSSPKLDELLATQVANDTSKYTPAVTGNLNKQTRVEGRFVIYNTPYARMLYYGKFMVDAVTGEGPPYRLGATLKATDRDLKFDKSMNAKATALWVDASMRDNIDRWERVMKRGMKRYAGK